jgi:antirestriction protein ArdC
VGARGGKLRAYSAGNCMLLAHQCYERGIDPQYIAGFRSWLKLGCCVRRSEQALRIFAPVTVTERDERGHRPSSAGWLPLPVGNSGSGRRCSFVPRNVSRGPQI